MKIFNIIRKAESTIEDYKGQHGAPEIEVSAPLHNLTLNGVYPDDIYGNEARRMYDTGFQSDGEAFQIIASSKGRPRRPIVIYRAVPDINRSIDKEIKALRALLSYKTKYGFLPIGNKKVDEFEAKYEKGEDGVQPMEKELNEWLSENPNKNFWDWGKEMVSRDIRAEIASLRSIREPDYKINSGDWVAISKGYAIEHGNSNLNGIFKVLQKTVPACTLHTNGDSIQEWAYYP